MHFSVVAAVFACFTMIKAAQINVSVGANNTLTYSPESVTAQQGDTIVFEFQSKNHTITQSTFADPCTPLAKGTDSGFRPVAANATTKPVFKFNVTDTSSPLWFYCAQKGHCPSGMVFAINPTANKTFAAFQAKAKAQSASASGSVSGTSTGAGTPTGTGTGTGTGASASPSTSQASGALRIGGTAMGTIAAAAAVFGLVL